MGKSSDAVVGSELAGAARGADASLTAFACFDAALADAARAEGFTLVS